MRRVFYILAIVMFLAGCVEDNTRHVKNEESDSQETNISQVTQQAQNRKKLINLLRQYPEDTGRRVMEEWRDDKNTAFETLITLLGEEDDEIQWFAEDALIQIGEPVAEHLVRSLKHEDSRIRRGVIWPLAEIQGRKASKFIIASLRDEDWEVRCSSAEAFDLTP